MTRDAVAVSGASAPRAANAAATARLEVGASSHRTRSGVSVDTRASRRTRQGVTSTSAAPASSPAGTDATHRAAAVSPSRVNRIDSNGAGGQRADAPNDSDSIRRDPSRSRFDSPRSVARTSTSKYVGSATRASDPIGAARGGEGFSRPTRGSVAPGGTRVTRPPSVRTHASTPNAFTTGRLAGTAASARRALAVAAMTSSANACVSTARNGVAPETRSVVPSGRRSAEKDSREEDDGAPSYVASTDHGSSAGSHAATLGLKCATSTTAVHSAATLGDARPRRRAERYARAGAARASASTNTVASTTSNRAVATMPNCPLGSRAAGDGRACRAGARAVWGLGAARSFSRRLLRRRKRVRRGSRLGRSRAGGTPRGARVRV